MSLEAWGDENPDDAYDTDHLIDAGWLAPDDADVLRDENMHLRAIITSFLAKYAACKPHLTDAFTFQMIHGIHYSGPDWSRELDALQEAVKP